MAGAGGAAAVSGQAQTAAAFEVAHVDGHKRARRQCPTVMMTGATDREKKNYGMCEPA